MLVSFATSVSIHRFLPFVNCVILLFFIFNTKANEIFDERNKEIVSIDLDNFNPIHYEVSE